MLKGLFVLVAYRDVDILVEDDSVALNGSYLLEIDNKGTMNLHKFMTWKMFCYLFQSIEGHYGFLIFEVYLDVIAHAFDISDVVEIDAHNSVFRFNEKELVVVFNGGWFCVFLKIALSGFVDRL